MKRCLDLVITAVGVLALGPVGAVVAFLVAARLGRPVVFRQVRPGMNGELFEMYKFRTMTDDTDSNGVPLPDSQRLTSFGRALRATSLDELPEFWNVVRGDMSLVGPRPLLSRYTSFFTETERRRLEVKPGITGWAQVNGRNLASWDDRLAMDVWYVDNRSVFLDLKILALTLLRVVSRSGLVPDPETAMMNLDDERSQRARP